MRGGEERRREEDNIQEENIQEAEKRGGERVQCGDGAPTGGDKAGQCVSLAPLTDNKASLWCNCLVWSVVASGPSGPPREATPPPAARHRAYCGGRLSGRPLSSPGLFW
ncbi:hypothetical protein NHX12_034027, partial [Muraenolepis orangiensis]